MVPFSCYKRLPFLKTLQSRNVFQKELGDLRSELGFRVIRCDARVRASLLINEPPGPK